jgi:hypothetical protein
VITLLKNSEETAPAPAPATALAPSAGTANDTAKENESRGLRMWRLTEKFILSPLLTAFAWPFAIAREFYVTSDFFHNALKSEAYWEMAAIHGEVNALGSITDEAYRAKCVKLGIVANEKLCLRKVNWVSSTPVAIDISNEKHAAALVAFETEREVEALVGFKAYVPIPLDQLEYVMGRVQIIANREESGNVHSN